MKAVAYINAHGGGMLYDNGTYYWFGEHKIAGNQIGVESAGDEVPAVADLRRNLVEV